MLARALDAVHNIPDRTNYLAICSRIQSLQLKIDELKERMLALNQDKSVNSCKLMV